MSEAAPPTGKRARGPITVYTAVSVVVLLLIATLALTTGGAAPPAIAAFAPQSIQQIKHAPANQNGGVGNPGGAHVGKKVIKPTQQATPKPTASHKAKTPPPKVPPKALPGKDFDCVGNPPRQTADPQSPPCVESFEGKNGGATSPGVTGNEIRVYMPPLFDSSEYDREVKDLQQYFNTHFEFYGRSLNLDPQASGGGAEPSATGTCSNIQAQADWVAKQLSVFAAADDGSDSCWYDELGRDKVISLSGQTTENEAEQVAEAPYLYSYPGNGDSLYDATGQFVCSQLAGKDATYSSNPLFQRTKRTFGIIETATLSQIPTPQKELLADLASCGIKPKVDLTLQASGSDNSGQNTEDTTNFAAQAQNAVVKMNGARVSTVICFCQIVAAAEVSSAAETQNYHPEWIAERSDQNILAQGWVPGEKSSLLEVSQFPRQIPDASSFFEQALEQEDPGFCPCATSLDFLYGDLTYWQLLMLASGIQMAGPDLTPLTFQHALQTTVFPNPTDPLDEGHVSFAGGHTMISNFLVGWWNEDAQSPTQGDAPGSWCYAEGGERINLGAFPTHSILPPDLATAKCTT